MGEVQMAKMAKTINPADPTASQESAKDNAAGY